MGLPENCSLHTEKDVGVLSISLSVSLKGIKKVKKTLERGICTSQYSEKLYMLVFWGYFSYVLEVTLPVTCLLLVPTDPHCPTCQSTFFSIE